MYKVLVINSSCFLLPASYPVKLLLKTKTTIIRLFIKFDRRFRINPKMTDKP